MASKAVYHRVKHDHIKPRKRRQIQGVQPERGQGTKLSHINDRHKISRKNPQSDQNPPCRSAPFSQFLHRFVDVFFPDYLHDIGSVQIPPGSETGKGHHHEKKGQRNQQASEIKGKFHVRTVT